MLKSSKKVTAILLGAGHRGADAYASYALQYPEELTFVGVAEPRKERREEFQKAHNIEDKYAVESWEELLAFPKLADLVLICTQDHMHMEPMSKAMELGYDILVEKPISPVKEELIDLKEKTENYEGMISVCHVLRYSPFFRKIKEILDAGTIGELMNIQHMESIGFWHMAHSFVRGNWRNTEESSPICLAKTCHDFDILLWLTGKKCLRVSSFGSLKLFRKEMAPEGAPERCTDGCPHRSSCPFFAPKFYLEHPKAIVDGFRKVVTMDETTEGLMQALKTGPYGRCVYACDNDVCDHQVVNMDMEGGLTISFTLSAFTNECERTITLQGSRGEIKGWMEEDKIVVTDFVTGNKTIHKLNTPKIGHSGSDASMMQELISLIATGRQKENVSNATQAIDSHLIAFAAEESRLANGKVIEL
ncbi:MAG: Gfo/Idh/MocA family oxidoreductase [Lachnospiraceae bacterium]|nr:Gfo/Idh/MocA family oxidoreductase [Lachnospiraceae bacterium]